MQPDSIIPSPANPQSWNRYSYVENRPILYNDPFGHDSVCGYSYSDPECPEDDTLANPLPPEDPPPGDPGNSCNGPNPSVICLNDSPTPESELTAELITVYLGGLTPAGIPGIAGDANNPTINKRSGSKALGVIEILQLLKLIFSTNAPKNSPGADVFLTYQLLNNGQVDKMVITVDNHSGSSNIYIDGVVIQTALFEQTVVLQPSKPIAVPSGEYGQMSLCDSRCLSDSVNIISTSELPINSGLGVTVSPIIGGLFDFGGATGLSYQDFDFPYTVPPR